MSGPGHIETPQRLAEKGGEVGRLLAEAAADAAQVPVGARTRVWRALQEPAKPLWVRPAFAVGGLAAACAAALVLYVQRPAAPAPALLAVSVEQGSTLSLADAAGHALPASAALTDGMHVAAGQSGALLRSGASTLALAAFAKATLHEAQGAVEVWLESGDAAVGAFEGGALKASLHVVAAGAFRIEAPPGAVFIVSATERVTSVHALRGEATVRSAAGEAKVAAGSSWSSSGAAPALSESQRALGSRAAPGLALAVPDRLPAAAPAVPPAAAAPAVPPAAAPAAVDAPLAPAAAGTAGAAAASPAPRSTRLLARAAEDAAQQGEEFALDRAYALEARGDNAGAAAAFAALTKGSGPHAEAALYELGRLRLRFLGQPQQALQAFGEHDRRFPQGALSLESSLSAVEARVALGQGEPALREMGSFLQRFGTSERAADVRWLRASLYQGRGDCRRALPDLEALARGSSRAGDAIFLLATCARSEGDLAGARERLLEYQRRFADGPHRSEVDAALRGEETP
jgi:hypothetical protein